VTGKVTVTGAVISFFSLYYVSFSVVLLDGNSHYLVFLVFFSFSIRFFLCCFWQNKDVSYTALNPAP